MDDSMVFPEHHVPAFHHVPNRRHKPCPARFLHQFFFVISPKKVDWLSGKRKTNFCQQVIELSQCRPHIPHIIIGAL